MDPEEAAGAEGDGRALTSRSSSESKEVRDSRVVKSLHKAAIASSPMSVIEANPTLRRLRRQTKQKVCEHETRNIFHNRTKTG